MRLNQNTEVTIQQSGIRALRLYGHERTGHRYRRIVYAHGLDAFVVRLNARRHMQADRRTYSAASDARNLIQVCRYGMYR